MDKLTKFESKTEDDTEYLEWGLDQQETRFYKAIKKKQEEAQVFFAFSTFNLFYFMLEACI